MPFLHEQNQNINDNETFSIQLAMVKPRYNRNGDKVEEGEEDTSGPLHTIKHVNREDNSDDSLQNQKL